MSDNLVLAEADSMISHLGHTIIQIMEQSQSKASQADKQVEPTRIKSKKE
jgi:hypothetical protein